LEQQLFKSLGDLEIIPSNNSSQNDFDFFVGKWKIQNRKLKTRLNNCREWLEFEATAEVFKILNAGGRTRWRQMPQACPDLESQRKQTSRNYLTKGEN